jgi:hypothetical protein
MNDYKDWDWYSDKPHSFGGKYRSYNNNVSKKEIEENFKHNEIYSRFKQFRKTKKQNPVYVYAKREQFQADVCFFNNPLMVKSTKGVKYLLVVIDVYTKFVWLYPLKEIKSEKIAECFKSLFEKEKPQKITTDAGKEFLNRNVSRVLEEFNITHYIAKNLTKAQVVERFNLTLQRLLFQICTYENTNNWVLQLPKALKIYLNRYHRTIKMTPSQAEMKKNQSILSNIYFERYDKLNPKHKTKFAVGEKVRISLLRTKFGRGYHEYFSTEVWIIKKILKNLPYPRYIVQDETGEELDAILNENELVSFSPPQDTSYIIEKVIKSRKKGKKKQYFVKWEGYPSKFNSWVNEEEIKHLKQD